MEGSLRTIPSPRTNIRVFAVPRSIARSSENCSAHRLNNITLPDNFQIYHVPREGSSSAEPPALVSGRHVEREDRKSTRLNSSHSQISYAVFCLKKKKT